MATRITGLATGLDIDSIVKTTMKAYQTKIDTQIQKKDVLEIKQKLYRDLVQKSQDFFNKYLDRSSKDCLRQSSNYTSVKFNATTSSGAASTAVSVKGLNGAEAQNYKVQVLQTAEKATKTLKASDLNGVTGIRINGHEVAISSDDSSAQIVEKINAMLKEKKITDIKVKYSDFSQGIVIESTKTGRSAEFTLGLVKSGSAQNTMKTSTYVAEGRKPTAAYTELKIDDFKDVDDITINGQNISLDDINKRYKKTNDDGTTSITNGAQYLAEIKSVIDKTFTNDADLKDKTPNVIVDGQSGTLTLQSQTAGVASTLTSVTVGTEAKTITAGDPGTAGSMELDLSSLSGYKAIMINDAYIDLSDIKREANDSDATYLEKYKNRISTSLAKAGNLVGVDIDITTAGNKITLATAQPGNKFSVMAQKTDNTLEQFAGTTGNGDITIQGTNAVAKLINQNGETFTSSSEKNSVVIDNTQFTFNNVTSEYINVTGTNDATELKDKIVKFIDDYNKLIIDLNKAVTTKHNKSYSPLTADQKKEMSESEIKLWNEKVEEGQLYRDSDLIRITDALKTTMRTVMSETGQRLEAIGIKPVKDYTGTKNGTFYIESEEALKEAIEQNPEDVMNLFIGGSVTNVTPGDGKTGILNQLYYTLNKEMFGSFSSLSKKVGFEGTSTFTNNTITNNISNYEKKIKDMQTQYLRKEQALYSKYSTLESAMNKYNSQLAYLTSAFSS